LATRRSPLKTRGNVVQTTGATSGGAVRSSDYGGTGPAGGGAGGWLSGPQAGQGQFGNVVSGGTGNSGYLQIQYTNW